MCVWGSFSTSASRFVFVEYVSLLKAERVGGSVNIVDGDLCFKGEQSLSNSRRSCWQLSE